MMAVSECGRQINNLQNNQQNPEFATGLVVEYNEIFHCCISVISPEALQLGRSVVYLLPVVRKA